jgi:broad specificity polyphosphatase/5'/3'-nucleotidase SurE
MEYCVNVLAPKLFGGSKPDIVVSGPNEGEDVDKGILLSSTIHAVRAATGDSEYFP